MAQVTTLPVLTIPFAFSGLLFPLALLPEPLRWLAQALPLRPEVTLMRLGLTGTAAGGHHLGMATTFGAAAIPDDSRQARERPYQAVPAKDGPPADQWGDRCIGPTAKLGVARGGASSAWKSLDPRVREPVRKPALAQSAAPADRDQTASRRRWRARHASLAGAAAPSCGFSCGPARVVTSRNAGHSGTNRRPDLPVPARTKGVCDEELATCWISG
jgi:hypothetical protein